MLDVTSQAVPQEPNPTSPATLNISDRLRTQARERPDSVAIVIPAPMRAGDKQAPVTTSFAELDSLTDCRVKGLAALGLTKGTRVLMMVRPSIEFFAITFGLMRLGAIPVFIDPAMGRKSMLTAIEGVEPKALIGIPRAHLARLLFPRTFRSVDLKVSVGRAWFGGIAIDRVHKLGEESSALPNIATAPEDLAAILFTSGSTGAAKGVEYTHAIFDAQVDVFRQAFKIAAGETELSAFPLFSLFSIALGVTVVVPEMDTSHPATVEPEPIAAALEKFGVNYAFGAPSFWHRVVDHCERQEQSFPALSRILMAGAPAPSALLRRLDAVVGDHGDVFTPYGATECLPITFPSVKKLLSETIEKSEDGRGNCVGAPVGDLQVRIIGIDDAPIETLPDAKLLGPEEVGEIIVTGSVATQRYFRRPENNRAAKILDGDRIWHRMGDVGYLDAAGNLWFCGRKNHRVETSDGPLYSIPVEAIFNRHPKVFRSALVGLGERGAEKPIVVIECPPPGMPRTNASKHEVAREVLGFAHEHRLGRRIDTVLFHPSLPVDTRHNAKIRREALREWAQSRTS